MEKIMFNDTRLKNYAQLLGLNTQELDIFMRRYKGYLSKHPVISKNILINGLFILDEVVSSKANDEANKIKYKTKNLLIIKYQKEIIELYKNGSGSISIVKHLKLNHRVVLSKSSVDRFIKANNIMRS